MVWMLGGVRFDNRPDQSVFHHCLGIQSEVSMVIEPSVKVEGKDRTAVNFQKILDRLIMKSWARIAAAEAEEAGAGRVRWVDIAND